MFSALRWSTLVFVLIMSSMAFAHRGHSHNHDHNHDGAEVQELQLDGVTSRELTRLMDEAHHAIEPDETGLTFAQKVRAKLRFKQNFLNAYRWASQNQDRPEVANARANIAVMLLTSHMLETVGGVGMAGLGLANGLESYVDQVMTVVGMIIPIPGLDPACIALMYTYKKWPHGMNRILTKPRVFLLKGMQASNQMLGMPNGWVDAAYSMISKKKFLQRYLSGGAIYSAVALSEDRIRFQAFGAQEGQHIDLYMDRQPSGELALTSVRFSEKAPAMGRSYIKQLLKPFGLNIQGLVLEIDEHLGRRSVDPELKGLSHLSYIEKVQVLPGAHHIHVKPGAFPFHNLHESDFGCEEKLMARAAQIQ